jgi:hypothetical protein
MPDTALSMPVAVVPVGDDPATFYAGFAGKMTPSWSPSDGLIVWAAAEIDIARLHAPTKAAMRFAPAGTSVGGAPLASDSLLLQTWPTTYVDIKNAIKASVPSEIRFENVAAATVRNSVTPLFTAIGRSSVAVDAFMAGDGLLRVTAGTAIGAAAPAAGAPSAAVPNRVKILMFDGFGASLNALQFFSNAADHAGVDKTQHPMLSQLDLDGWIEVEVLDTSGTRLSGEQYALYLSDGTLRTGTTGASGQIYETGIPAGGWAIDLPNQPSFEFNE